MLSVGPLFGYVKICVEREALIMGMGLQQLFDLQHFAPNSKLQSMIDDTMRRYGGSARQELGEDDLEMLYAAGTPYAAEGKKGFGQRDEDLDEWRP